MTQEQVWRVWRTIRDAGEFLNTTHINDVVNNLEYIKQRTSGSFNEQDIYPPFPSERIATHNTRFEHIKPILNEIEQRFDFLDRAFVKLGWKTPWRAFDFRYTDVVPTAKEVELWRRLLNYYRRIINSEIGKSVQLHDRNGPIYVRINKTLHPLWVQTDRFFERSVEYINWEGLWPGAAHGGANNILRHLTTDSSIWNSTFTVSDNAAGLAPGYDRTLAIQRTVNDATTRIALWTPNLAGAYGLRMWVTGFRGTLHVQLRGRNGNFIQRLEISRNGWVDIPFSGVWFENGPTRWRNINVAPEQLQEATHMWIAFYGLPTGDTVHIGTIRKFTNPDILSQHNFTAFNSGLDNLSNNIDKNNKGDEEFWKNFWKDKF